MSISIISVQKLSFLIISPVNKYARNIQTILPVNITDMERHSTIITNLTR